ncbi:MAG: hypothetical protein IJH95_04255, partial [Mogibacterium sp.]|nr:hypothetical protein [Mogibacterium sp.]
LKKLTDAESAFSVASVKEKINALPAADEVTTANKDAIEAARGFYDALTDEEKAKVAPETLKKLTDAESALAVATANEAINALPAADEVTTANKDAIEAARKAYDELTATQKKKVSADNLKKIETAEKALAAAVEKSVKTVTVNAKTVSAKTLKAAVAKAGGSSKYVKTIVLGKKVKKISKGVFKNYKKAKTLIV